MLTTLKLDTRKGNHIHNVLDETPPIPGMVNQSQSFRVQFSGASHRETETTRAYNCHGLTFASRRTAILDIAALRKLLVDDGYVVVQSSDVKAGDIVLYIGKGGDIVHSGIVVGKEQIGFRVLSKWGAAHEVIHMQGDTPYQTQTIDYEFRRIKK